MISGKMRIFVGLFKQSIVCRRHSFVKNDVFRRHSTPINFYSTRFDGKLTFDQFTSLRKAEARKSVLIHLASRARLENGLLNICTQHGPVKQLFTYTLSSGDHMLIEYEDRDSLESLMKSACHFSNLERIPVETRVLYYTGSTGSLQKKKKQNRQNLPLVSMAGQDKDRSEDGLQRSLQKAESISDQMSLVHRHEKLSDLHARLRFFVCTVIEEMLSGLFPHTLVSPFGSSVNGFGKKNSDLDLNLELEDLVHLKKESELKFMTKKRLNNERRFTQGSLEIVHNMLKMFVPQLSNLVSILNARVPIVKFYHQGADVECDLTMTNRTGTLMSELLYVFSSLDDRVKDLVFTVRKIAQVQQLTRSDPGPWVSNFALIVMVIYFLQTSSVKILPSVRALLKNQGHPETSSIRLNMTEPSPIITNMKLLPFPDSKTNSGELLREFLEFYAGFDFENRAISIFEGQDLSKPDFSPIYIENPLERQLNISKNMNSQELGRLCKLFKTSLMELVLSKTVSASWGISSLFDKDLNHQCLCDGKNVPQMWQIFEPIKS